MTPMVGELAAGLATRWGILGLSLAVILVLYLVHRRSSVQYPEGMQLIWEPKGARSFSWRTRMAYYTNCAAMFRDAYDHYLKKGVPVVIPGLGVRHEVILPQSLMRWVQAQPDDVLSLPHAFVEIDQVRSAMGSEHIVLDPWQGMLVKTHMNRVLEQICANMNDELAVVFDQRFGTDVDSWREIDLYETVKMIVCQAAGRFTVGLPLCRNEEYLRLVHESNDGFILNAGLTGSMPKILRPLVGVLATWSLKQKQAILKRKFLEPLWQERLRTLEHDPSDPAHVEPGDHVQMMARFAQTDRPRELHDVDTMMHRISLANIGATHQTGIQTTNLLLNILASDREYNTVAVLRDEADRVLGQAPGLEHGGQVVWTKALVSQLVKADSAARETLRLHSFGGRGVFRMVMTPGGVVTPGGHRLPEGTTMSFLGQPASTDPETVEDPLKYDPFRFSRGRDADGGGGGGGGGEKTTTTSSGGASAAASFVTTSPEFLPFGHGKHACPGRFLVDFELKMIISYVLRNYDMRFPDEYGGKRPPNRWISEALFPPEGARIMVRRRKT